jgi:hypothetical protein
LFAAYRYHPVFTDSPEPMLDAEATHRDHAIIEQVIADLKSSAIAHLPSGRFNANGAWLVRAAIAYNLTCAAATIRDQLINTPGRVARSANRLVLHQPRDWPWETALNELFTRTARSPLPTTA